jgi:hypothetical protein
MFMRAAPLLALALLSMATTAPPEKPLVREDWRETPAALPVTRAHVSNPDLELVLLGPGRDRIKKSHHDQPADDPYYVWSGEAGGTWAVALRYKTGAVDITRGRIRWRSRQSGYRQLHPIVQLSDGSWLVADNAVPASGEWRVDEFVVADLTWRALDAETIVEGRPAAEPRLDRTTAVGCTDLMRGGGTPASSRLDWIEVYGVRAGS